MKTLPFILILTGIFVCCNSGCGNRQKKKHNIAKMEHFTTPLPERLQWCIIVDSGQQYTVDGVEQRMVGIYGVPEPDTVSTGTITHIRKYLVKTGDTVTVFLSDKKVKQ